jgi:hypothetical protein
MTTPLSTITSLLPHLTAEQLEIIENYTTWFCRQNLAAQIGTLPNTSLVDVGLYINTIAKPLQPIVIPPPPQFENAVPTNFLPELPPSPMAIETFDELVAKVQSPPLPSLADLLPPWCRENLQKPQPQHQQHPQLKSPSPEEPCGCFNCVASRDCYEEVKCPGCLSGEWGQMAHMGPDGCFKPDENEENDNHRSGGCRGGGYNTLG